MLNKKLFIFTLILFLTLLLGSSFISPILAEEETILEGEVILEEEQACQPTQEICDGIDNDCDGEIDEELTQQCGTTDIGVCEYGIQSCQTGVWGDCIGAIEPSEEICDTLDNDCDGEIDEDEVCEEVEITEETEEIEEVAETEEPTELEELTESEQLIEPEELACQPINEICDGIDNDCDGQIDEDGVCEEALELQEPEQSFEPEEPVYIPPQEIEQPQEPEPQEPEPQEPEEPTFDPATAPSKVTIRVLMPNGSSPPFPVFVTFVGVGNKNFGGKINANGELTLTMPSGRYYTELMIINTEYVQGEDGPSFFLEANEERDFGAIRLIPKSEMTSQPLEEKSLEENVMAELENTKGIGKILVLIIKLLIKILEEVRMISAQLFNR